MTWNDAVVRNVVKWLFFWTSALSLCSCWWVLRATLGCLGSEVTPLWRVCFLFFHNVRLDGFGSQTTAWLGFHSVVSIVTKRRSGWPLLGAEIEPALNSLFGILAQGTKEGHFGCWVPLVSTGRSKHNWVLLVVLELCVKWDGLFWDFQAVFSNLKYFIVMNL